MPKGGTACSSDSESGWVATRGCVSGLTHKTPHTSAHPTPQLHIANLAACPQQRMPTYVQQPHVCMCIIHTRHVAALACAGAWEEHG